jgi:hypothetical protein
MHGLVEPHDYDELVTTIPLRHTNRKQRTGAPLTADILKRIHQAAESIEGAAFLSANQPHVYYSPVLHL